MIEARQQHLSHILPQVILAGAPKCGTTSVYHDLAVHPEIMASSVKETYFLIDPGYPLYRDSISVHRHGPEGYRAFFDVEEGGTKGLRFEATPDYLYQSTPLEMIPSWPVKPKILFILRRPEDRVYSLFRFAQNNVGNIDANLSFADFLHMVAHSEEALPGREILANAIEHSKYVNFLEKWRSAIGRDSMKILLYEDLREDPVGFMMDIARYLEIDPNFYANHDFSRANTSIRVRSRSAQVMRNTLTRFVGNTSLRRNLARLYRRINHAPLPGKSDADRLVLKELASTFISSNLELERQFELDLDRWKSAAVQAMPELAGGR